MKRSAAAASSAAGKPHAKRSRKTSRRRGKYGEEVRRRREALGMTQKQLGVVLGDPEPPIPLATISRWERGGAIEHPGMLLKALTTIEREHGQDTAADVNT